MGEIVRVQPARGEHYSPAEGPRPLTLLFVRICRPEQSAAGKLMEIRLLEVYSAATHGEAGDIVSFRCSGQSSFADEASFSDLDEYRIVSRHAADQH